MTGRLQDVLRVQPSTMPALRASFATALTQLDDALAQLSREGNLIEPWLADETSSKVLAHYTQRAMIGPASSYESLAAYRDEIGRIHDTLQRIEDDYYRTEGDTAARFGRTA